MFKYPDFNISKSLKLDEKANASSVPYYKKVLSQIIGEDITNKTFDQFKYALLTLQYNASKI